MYDFYHKVIFVHAYLRKMQVLSTWKINFRNVLQIHVAKSVCDSQKVMNPILCICMWGVDVSTWVLGHTTYRSNSDVKCTKKNNNLMCLLVLSLSMFLTFPIFRPYSPLSFFHFILLMTAVLELPQQVNDGYVTDFVHHIQAYSKL